MWDPLLSIVSIVALGNKHLFGIYNLCDLLSYHISVSVSICCGERSQIASLLFNLSLVWWDWKFQLSVVGGTVVVSWLPSVDSLLMIWWLCFLFLLCQTASHIFGMGVRWWAFVICNLRIEEFICVSIYLIGMVSSCFGGINLALAFLPYSFTFGNLPKLLSGHFS